MYFHETLILMSSFVSWRNKIKKLAWTANLKIGTRWHVTQMMPLLTPGPLTTSRTKKVMSWSVPWFRFHWNQSTYQNAASWNHLQKQVTFVSLQGSGTLWSKRHLDSDTQRCEALILVNGAYGKRLPNFDHQPWVSGPWNCRDTTPVLSRLDSTLGRFQDIHVVVVHCETTSEL